MYQGQRNGQQLINNEVEGGEAIALPYGSGSNDSSLLYFIDDSDNACEVAPSKRTRASQKEK